MQILWYLPSLVIGLLVGFQSGYWQVALMSVVMVFLMALVGFYRNRYPSFDDSSAVHVSLSGVAIGNRVLPKRQLFWKKQWHEILYRKLEGIAGEVLLADLILRKREMEFSVPAVKGDLKFWLGYGENSEQELNLVSDGPHLLIVGPTGSGKSELLHLILTSTLASQQIDLALLDFKGGATLGIYAEFSSIYATDLDSRGHSGFWEFIDSELQDRERQFARTGTAGIEEWISSGNSMARILVVIDELSAVLNSGLDASRGIENIVARGRSLGIHLIAATQSLSGIPRSSLTNLRTRIAMAASDPVDLVQLGINPSRQCAESAPGWASCWLVRSNQLAVPLLFPLGVRKVPIPEGEIEAGEQQPPVRSQLLRQMYSDQELELDPIEAQVSSHDLQLLSRMAKLRS